MDFLVSFLVCWGLLNVYYYMRENGPPSMVDEQSVTTQPKFVLLQLEVECIKGMWYGWVLNEEEGPVFAGQGESYEEAVSNCRERIQEKNPEYKIVFKFVMKYDEQPALQN